MTDNKHSDHTTIHRNMKIVEDILLDLEAYIKMGYFKVHYLRGIKGKSKFLEYLRISHQLFKVTS